MILSKNKKIDRKPLLTEHQKRSICRTIFYTIGILAAALVITSPIWVTIILARPDSLSKVIINSVDRGDVWESEEVTLDDGRKAKEFLNQNGSIIVRIIPGSSQAVVFVSGENKWWHTEINRADIVAEKFSDDAKVKGFVADVVNRERGQKQ